MSTKELLNKMKREFNEAMSSIPAIINHSFEDESVGDEDGRAFVVVNLYLYYPENVLRQNHTITLACYDLDEPEIYGIDYYTEDRRVGDIAPINIMTTMYFDLGLKDIEDQYLI